MERIRVSDDRWNFEGVETGKRFIPFGSNFMFYYYADESKEKTAWSWKILTENPFRKDIIERAFAVAQELNMNVMKVFIPITDVLPDPQVGTHARIADLTPSLFERLEFVFEMAETYGVYISLTLAEWGLGTLDWFHDGGQFFGPAHSGTNVDSLAILADFWKQVAAWAKGRPQLFSYNLAVESYLPEAACKDTKKGNEIYMYSERYGADAYRSFLRTKYGTVDALNQAHGSSWANFEEVLPPEDIQWNAYHETYNYPSPIVVDYIEFKEVVCYYYYKNAVDALRSVDPDHMVSLGLHPDQCGIGPKGFAYKIANIQNRLLDYIDYVTIHLYTQMSYLIDRPLLPPCPSGRWEPCQGTPQELERRRHECLLYTRFVYGNKPVLLEEFGHFILDEEDDPGRESYECTYKLLQELIGHVSGVMIWNYGCYAGEGRTMSRLMDLNLEITSWGEKWKELMAPGGAVAELPLERAPARTVVRLDYEQAYAPTKETPGEWILDHWNDWLHPVDFELEENRALVAYKQQKKNTVW